MSHESSIDNFSGVNKIYFSFFETNALQGIIYVVMYLAKRLLPVFIILLSLITVLPILHSGFFPMHDDTQPTRVFEMATSLSDGMFPVRWTKDLGFGFGYPIFNFYAPFPYYVGGAVHLIGLDTLSATKLMMIVPAIAGGVGMYLFVASFLGVEAGAASAVIYLFFSYFAVNMYVRGAVGEYYAYGFMPYVFWSVLKVYYETKKQTIREVRKWILLGGASISLLIISHNLSAFMLFFLLAVPLILSVIFHSARKRLLLSYIFVFLLAFLLSAFYVLPALLEMNYTNVQSQVGGGADFHDHFVCLSQLWASTWGYGGSARGCIDGLSFALGKSTIIFSLLGITLGIFLWFQKKLRGERFFFVFALVLGIPALFMTTAFSVFVWNTVPFIAFLQYPWRFLDFVGISCALLSGFLLYAIKRLLPQVVVVICLIFLVGATLFYNIKLFQPQYYEPRTAAYYTQPSQISFLISKISDEYMPRHFSLPKTEQEVPQKVMEGSRNITKVHVLDSKTGNISGTVQSIGQGLLKLNIAPFPAWHILLDGKETNFSKTNKGLVVTTPSGTHTVQAVFWQTPIELFGDILSITGILVLLAGIIYPRWRKRNS